MKMPERKTDIRIKVTETVFAEFNSFHRIKKGTVLDGWIDNHGNFRFLQKDEARGYLNEVTIYPTHFKILGRFYFRKSK